MLGVCADNDVAEILAIVEALKLARELLRFDHDRVIVYTDSQAAIYDFINFTENGQGPVFAETLKVLNWKVLCNVEGYQVELRWVKGHNVCTGNVVADKLAGVASEHALRIGADPTRPLYLQDLNIDAQWLRVMVEQAKADTLAKRRRVTEPLGTMYGQEQLWVGRDRARARSPAERRGSKLSHRQRFLELENQVETAGLARAEGNGLNGQDDSCPVLNY